MQDELKQQYIDSLPGRLETLKSLARDLRGGNADAGKEIRLQAHSLYGSGATFGFPGITEAAGKVENATDAELIKHLTVLATVLNNVIDQAKLPDVPSILLIEDDVDNAAFLRASLESSIPDIRIDTAHNGSRAQEFLVKQPYSLIILDLMLPDRDGRDLLREIRNDFQLTNPILVLTGIDKDVVRVECMSYGADKVLLKPFDEETLLPVVRKLLEKANKPQLALVPKGNENLTAPGETGRVKMDLSGKTVLLAEDDMVQAKLIQQRLIQEGLAVQHVQNGREAMAALRTREFSLVILDVKMPLFDGFEVLERIRGELGLKKVPVIMLTALGSEADIIRGYDLGANDYILKPFNLVQVVARIKTLLK